MQKTAELNYDIVVVGGGPGGFPAAIAAARAGRKVLLVERNAFLGGAATSGLGILGFLDRQGQKALGGIAQELIDRLKKIGGSMGHFPCPVHNSITPVLPDMVKIVAGQMCSEAGVEVLYHAEMIDVSVHNGRVEKITVNAKATRIGISAKIFVDATGDGELAYQAGCRFVCGQEDGSMQPGTMMFTVSNFDLDKMFAYLEESEDFGIKEDYANGYNLDFFRNTKGHCLIGMDRLIEKARANGDFDVPRNQFIYITTPSDKLLAVNTSRIINLDATDPFQLSEAVKNGYTQVLQILQFMQKYIPGFENAVISQISPTLGLRETRHFVGIKTLTSDRLYAEETEKESIGRCAYNIDIHSANNDTIDLTLVERSFGIPYGCLVPGNMDGLLLSGRIISVDSRVFAATRVMGPCLAIGQAAGEAAAIAVQKGIPLSAVTMEELRANLDKAGVIL